MIVHTPMQFSGLIAPYQFGEAPSDPAPAAPVEDKSNDVMVLLSIITSLALLLRK